jgi:hypothetical protein
MERKLATVLFADLVGSTQLVASTDPEVVRSIRCPIASLPTEASSRSSPVTR